MKVTKPPLYQIWQDMKRRCLNKKRIEYPRYGGRGIMVCDRWLSFEKFIEDMGISYKEGLQLDRIDNDGNYEPSNCRWADRKTQCNNTRRNRRITYMGETKTLTQWARDLGMNVSTIGQRFYVYKWPLEKCLFNKTYKIYKRD